MCALELYHNYQAVVLQGGRGRLAGVLEVILREPPGLVDPPLWSSLLARGLLTLFHLAVVLQRERRRLAGVLEVILPEPPELVDPPLWSSLLARALLLTLVLAPSRVGLAPDRVGLASVSVWRAIVSLFFLETNGVQAWSSCVLLYLSEIVA